MRYVGHLDLFRSWERTFRRSGLSLAYSQGFHPQPRLNLACALPVGFTSECELLDAWLEDESNLHKIYEAVRTALPPGLEINKVEAIDVHSPSLQSHVASTVYRISFLDVVPDLADRLEKIISPENIIRQRRDRTYDLGPLIEQITIIANSEDGKQELRIQLSARESATGRPEEVLDEMGIKFEATQVHREKIILKK
jgi:radical SAM-linked protein